MLRGVLLLSCLVLAGCQSKGPPLPTTTEARGRVLLPNGQPLRGGRVVLNPTEPSAVEAFGDIDQSGAFTLTTYKVGDGAVPGRYKVSISPYNYRSTTGSPVRIPEASQIPPRYLEASTSDLTVEIKPGSNTLELRLVR
jgi:hypothetical protein